MLFSDWWQRASVVHSVVLQQWVPVDGVFINTSFWHLMSSAKV
jgi:hypothetical protein